MSRGAIDIKDLKDLKSRAETPPFFVARGPVPRDPRNKTQNVRSSRGLDVCCHDRCMARDRPSPYGGRRGVLSDVARGTGPREASCCLKQDSQDLHDFQDYLPRNEHSFLQWMPL